MDVLGNPPPNIFTLQMFLNTNNYSPKLMTRIDPLVTKGYQNNFLLSITGDLATGVSAALQNHMCSLHPTGADPSRLQLVS